MGGLGNVPNVGSWFCWGGKRKKYKENAAIIKFLG
jgi:hypothetical protein